ncbi:MAG: NAD(P)/FAD-dependent oxidoreductase [Promethearchaeota archaeon]
MLQKEVEVAIIGGGPAGMAAALEASGLGCKALIIERDEFLGGILQQCIHPGFGLHEFNEELAGPEYAQRYIDMIKEKDIEILLETMVLEITNQKEIFAVNERGVIKITADSIVLAMGCRERTRGQIKIPGYRPTGVYTAGLAQRFVNIEGFMPGTEFVILGSGDIGMIMARRLTWEGAKVHGVVEIQPYTSGLTRNKVQCLDDYGIPLYLSHTVVRVHGKDRVTGITIAEVDDKWRIKPGTEKFMNCDTLLLSVGLIPENEISRKANIILTKMNGPLVNQFQSTSISGIFACGNVLHVHDLVDNVAIEAKNAGKMAGIHAKITEVPIPTGKDAIIVEPGDGITYVLPHRINKNVDERILNEMEYMKFALRVKKPMNDVYIKLESNEKEIFKKFYRFARPSEMIIFNIKEKLVDFLKMLDPVQKILVSIEKKENKQEVKSNANNDQ